MKTLKTLSLLAVIAGCACCSTTPSGGTGTTGSGSSGTGGGGGDGGPYTILALDPDAGFQVPLAMAIGPNNQVGVVYFKPTSGSYLGSPNNALMYTEVQGQQITVPAEQVRVVQLELGLTVAFDGNTPAVGFLGGGSYAGADAGAGGNMTSLYWTQSQAEIDYRDGGGGWTSNICMTDSTENGTFFWKVIAADGTEDTLAEKFVDYPPPLGAVVGLWPSLLFDGGIANMAFRDVHSGQFPIQDWAGADGKMCIGTPPNAWSWQAPLTLDRGGSFKSAGFGVHNQLIHGAGGKMALISDGDPNDEGALVGSGSGVNFTIQTGLNTQSNADWSLPLDPFNPSGTNANAVIQGTGSGPSLVYDPVLGYAVAAVDTTKPALFYTSTTADPTLPASWPSMAQVVYQLGSGGFFPTLAVDPLSGIPNIAFTICSLSPGKLPLKHGCDDASLSVASLGGDGWDINTALKANVFLPKFGFLSTGKKVFVYSDLDNGGLFIALEN